MQILNNIYYSLNSDSILIQLFTQRYMFLLINNYVTWRESSSSHFCSTYRLVPIPKCKHAQPFRAVWTVPIQTHASIAMLFTTSILNPRIKVNAVAWVGSFLIEETVFFVKTHILIVSHAPQTESYVHPVSRDTLSIKEVARAVGHTANHAKQVSFVIDASLDIFGMEKIVWAATSTIVKLAKRVINVTNVCLDTIWNIILIL